MPPATPGRMTGRPRPRSAVSRRCAGCWPETPLKHHPALFPFRLLCDLHTMPRHLPPLPAVRPIGLLQPMDWLALPWHDMARAGWISFAHGLALTLFGAAILAVAHNRFWLLAGARSGFLVGAPVLATSLYALSRALERGEPANFALVLKTWLNWQGSHVNKWGHDYWCMLQFGALLALAATGWVLTSAALITLLAPVPVLTPLDFLRHVVLARDGSLFTPCPALRTLNSP